MNTEEKTCIRDARELGVPKMLLLGLQHMFAMFGATILVPILVNTYFEGEGVIRSGDVVFCRRWYTVLPIFVRNLKYRHFLVRHLHSLVVFCYSSESGYRYFCGYDNGRKTSICLWRYRSGRSVISGSGADHQACRR